MKSQSALEFMTIVGIGLVLLALTSIIGTDYISNYFSNIDVINARQSVSNIISASSLVYSQGVGAQTKVAVTIPSKMIRNFTYLSAQEVNFRFGQMEKPTDVFRDTGVNISGTIPLLSGKHYLYVKMAPNFFNPNKTEIHVYLEDSNYSYIGVQTFNDSDASIFSDNFAVGQKIYTGIIVANLTDYPKAPFVNFKIYNIGGLEIKDDSFNITSYPHIYGTTIYSPGIYLISIEIPQVNAVGTHMIHVHS